MITIFILSQFIGLICAFAMWFQKDDTEEKYEEDELLNR